MGKSKTSIKKGTVLNPRGRPKGSKNKVYKKNLVDIVKAFREIEENTGQSLDNFIVNEYKEYLKSVIRNKKISPAIKLKVYNDYLDRFHGKPTQNTKIEGQIDSTIDIKLEIK